MAQHYAHSFKNIASNATTTVKSGTGRLVALVFNKAGASSNTATLYDNTAGSGTKIATLDTTTVVAPVAVNYNLQFDTGLTVVTATGTAADITVVYD